MNQDRMKAALADAFSAETRQVLVEVLDDAYQAAGARFDGTIGCNGFTFGTDLYQFVRWRLQGCGDASAAPFPLGETSSDLELRLKLGAFNVACHRVGASATEDIAHCYPSSSGGPGRLARLNAIQLELDLGPGGRSPIPHNVVVAHLGNADNGLEAVYLAVPQGVTEAGKINQWCYTEQIWHWTGEGRAAPQVADLPPAVPIAEAQVELRAGAENAEDASS